MEDDVTITQDDMNTSGGKQPYMENPQTLYRKIKLTKNPPYCGLMQAIYILRQVFQLPLKTK